MLLNCRPGKSCVRISMRLNFAQFSVGLLWHFASIVCVHGFIVVCAIISIFICGAGDFITSNEHKYRNKAPKLKIYHIISINSLCIYIMNYELSCDDPSGLYPRLRNIYGSFWLFSAERASESTRFHRFHVDILYIYRIFTYFIWIYVFMHVWNRQ